MALKFDLPLEPSELGEAAYINALTHQRDSLLDRLADAPPQLEGLLELRAEAAVLRRLFKEFRVLVEGNRAEKKQRAQQHSRTLQGQGRY